MAYREITAGGYVRVLHAGRLWLEHRLVWERAHGKVPAGYQIHHSNGDRTDNRLENLRLVDSVEHKRIHSGCTKVRGYWWKPCRKCGVKKRIDAFYLTKGKWPYPWCKTCQKENAVRNKRLRAKRNYA